MFGGGYRARVLTGTEVDADEKKVVSSILPSLEHALLSRYSYSAIYYEHVRCKLVHEGELDGSATAHAMTQPSGRWGRYAEPATIPMHRARPPGEAAHERRIHSPHRLANRSHTNGRSER